MACLWLVYLCPLCIPTFLPRMDLHTCSSASSRHSHSEPNSKPAPVNRPSFTFIEHDDDLTSKRIKDVNARKAIRSHVMRDVRRRERLAGLKRTSKRDGRHPGASEAPYHAIDRSDERRLVLRASSSTSSVETGSGDSSTGSKSRRGRPVRWSAGYRLPFQTNPSPRSLPTSWFFDPFCALPGTSELPSTVAHLVFYWKSVFVPMTFPNVDKITKAHTSIMELMVQSSFSDPGSFFGLMSMCAAHRAVLTALHTPGGANRVLNDPDYCIMKAKSIREMNAKVRDPRRALSNEAFDTIINLLTGSLIVGLFDEVRIHLTGLKRMVELRGGITDDSIRSSSMLSAIITADVKAASGLMTKPVFPLTWDAQPVPQEVQQRIRPPASSPLNKIGSGFFANTLLSPPLLRILNVLRDMVFFSIAYRTTPAVIHATDPDFFRVLNCEAEHQLLSYVFTEDSGPKSISSGSELDLHPIEAVTRVASICFLNDFLIVSPSSSGLGRALTKHLKAAVSNCKLSFLVRLAKENFGLFVWALFIGAQGSLGHPERSWFVEQLGRVAMICGWQSWEQVSEILSDYFFVPSKANWRFIWDEAMTGFVISEV